MRRRTFVISGLAAAPTLLLAGCGQRLGQSLPAGDPTDSAKSPTRTQLTRLNKVGVPEKGKYYHGVYPGGRSGEEDDIEEADLRSYESKDGDAGTDGKGVGRKAAWVYFSHNWYRDGANFPTARAEWISRDRKRVPFIRLMLRGTPKKNELEIDFERCRVTKEVNLAGEYKLDNILRKREFREGLLRWGDAARRFERPLIVEWGTEMNGYWFPWNGWWNGKSEGPEKFKRAFRHIVNLVRNEAGATNITWVFHVNSSDGPDPADACAGRLDYRWNRFENYYPGDDVVDWLGMSVYGAQRPVDDYCTPFESQAGPAYDRLSAMTPDKPIFVLEFGATMNNPICGLQPADPSCRSLGGAALWADRALESILTNVKWRERLRGFSWWNETWENDENPANNTNMRVQDVPCLKEVFRKHLTDIHKDKITDMPIL